jgi:hypothetical protein
MYQVFNPDKNPNPVTKGKIWCVVQDKARYNDKLLHCTVDLKEAKCFAATEETEFYDPEVLPEVEEHREMNLKVEMIHQRFWHANAN